MTREVSLSRRVGPWLAMTGLVLLGACNGGGGGGNNPTPVTQPPQPTTSTILTGQFVGIPSQALGTFDFASPTTGTVTATATWTSGGNDVDIYVVAGNACTTTNTFGRPTGANCTILCDDDRVGGNTATCNLQATTSGQARLFIVNLGPGTESGTYSVTVRR
jgi:hypothetical protein